MVLGGDDSVPTHEWVPIDWTSPRATSPKAWFEHNQPRVQEPDVNEDTSPDASPKRGRHKTPAADTLRPGFRIAYIPPASVTASPHASPHASPPGTAPASNIADNQGVSLDAERLTASPTQDSVKQTYQTATLQRSATTTTTTTTTGTMSRRRLAVNNLKAPSRDQPKRQVHRVPSAPLRMASDVSSATDDIDEKQGALLPSGVSNDASDLARGAELENCVRIDTEGVVSSLLEHQMVTAPPMDDAVGKSDESVDELVQFGVSKSYETEGAIETRNAFLTITRDSEDDKTTDDGDGGTNINAAVPLVGDVMVPPEPFRDVVPNAVREVVLKAKEPPPDSEPADSPPPKTLLQPLMPTVLDFMDTETSKEMPLPPSGQPTQLHQARGTLFRAHDPTAKNSDSKRRMKQRKGSLSKSMGAGTNAMTNSPASVGSFSTMNVDIDIDANVMDSPHSTQVMSPSSPGPWNNAPPTMTPGGLGSSNHNRTFGTSMPITPGTVTGRGIGVELGAAYSDGLNGSKRVATLRRNMTATLDRTVHPTPNTDGGIWIANQKVHADAAVCLMSPFTAPRSNPPTVAVRSLRCFEDTLVAAVDKERAVEDFGMMMDTRATGDCGVNGNMQGGQTTSAVLRQMDLSSTLGACTAAMETVCNEELAWQRRGKRVQTAASLRKAAMIKARGFADPGDRSVIRGKSVVKNHDSKHVELKASLQPTPSVVSSHRSRQQHHHQGPAPSDSRGDTESRRSTQPSSDAQERLRLARSRSSTTGMNMHQVAYMQAMARVEMRAEATAAEKAAGVQHEDVKVRRARAATSLGFAPNSEFVRMHRELPPWFVDPKRFLNDTSDLRSAHLSGDDDLANSEAENDKWQAVWSRAPSAATPATMATRNNTWSLGSRASSRRGEKKILQRERDKEAFANKSKVELGHGSIGQDLLNVTDEYGLDPNGMDAGIWRSTMSSKQSPGFGRARSFNEIVEFGDHHLHGQVEMEGVFADNVGGISEVHLEGSVSHSSEANVNIDRHRGDSDVDRASEDDDDGTRILPNVSVTIGGRSDQFSRNVAHTHGAHTGVNFHVLRELQSSRGSSRGSNTTAWTVSSRPDSSSAMQRSTGAISWGETDNMFNSEATLVQNGPGVGGVSLTTSQSSTDRTVAAQRRKAKLPKSPPLRGLVTFGGSGASRRQPPGPFITEKR